MKKEKVLFYFFKQETLHPADGTSAFPGGKLKSIYHLQTILNICEILLILSNKLWTDGLIFLSVVLDRKEKKKKPPCPLCL